MGTLMSVMAIDETENPQTDLLNALSALRTTGRYADLTIACNYRQWAVHKAIVCPRSGFFDGACSNNFLEGSSGVIDLSEDDEEAVEQMIQFFYRLDYLDDPVLPPATVFGHRARADFRERRAKTPNLRDIEDPLLSQAGCYMNDELKASSPRLSYGSRSVLNCPERGEDSSCEDIENPWLTHKLGAIEESTPDHNDHGFESHLLLHARVYALAEKYDISSLKCLARAKFETAMACFYDSAEFAEAIEEVYYTTVDSDRGLRDIVVKALRIHPQLAITQDVYKVITSTPKLALDLSEVERDISV